MPDMSWLTAAPADVFSMLISGVVIYLVLLVCTRISGLRSFSKMSSFDFAITVAFGTILASTMLAKTPALVTGITGLAALFLIQALVAMARRLSQRIERLVGNQPMVLMAGEELLEDNLTSARVTPNDIRGKLRQAGITHRSQVLAVVLESTGDVSVLKRGEAVEHWMFMTVRDGDRVLALAGDTPGVAASGA